MDTTQKMTWKEFKEKISNSPSLNLQFQYAESKWVDSSYHITEIKQAPITSVDCGGVKNNWTEIIVQLWEPSLGKQEESMTVNKALSIISTVEKVLTLDLNGIVKIEFGNSQVDTRQMFPSSISIIENNLIVNLQPDVTQCKAIERGGNCGTVDDAESCCEVVSTPSIKNLTLNQEVCTPGSGCC